uniref:Photosystem I reaction center subunit VIII n=1 Tax=Eutreptia sp. CCAC 1914B TaxID=2979827 RepID=A0A977K7X9_9EUGL|nr:photosystem I subunit VIII [Eutreptia sp. CCAC 1914B]
MNTAILPSIFVPLIGLVLPVIAVVSFFIYVEEDKID